jgi:hypothetical protein
MKKIRVLRIICAVCVSLFCFGACRSESPWFFVFRLGLAQLDCFRSCIDFSSRHDCGPDFISSVASEGLVQPRPAFFFFRAVSFSFWIWVCQALFFFAATLVPPPELSSLSSLPCSVLGRVLFFHPDFCCTPRSTDSPRLIPVAGARHRFPGRLIHRS